MIVSQIAFGVCEGVTIGQIGNLEYLLRTGKGIVFQGVANNIHRTRKVQFKFANRPFGSDADQTINLPCCEKVKIRSQELAKF